MNFGLFIRVLQIILVFGDGKNALLNLLIKIKFVNSKDSTSYLSTRTSFMKTGLCNFLQPPSSPFFKGDLVAASPRQELVFL